MYYDEPVQRARPRITCADGFSVSIQASASHYCQPCTNDATYTHLELGFPSEAESSLMEYADSYGEPTETVYTYVPADTILRILESHGGIVEGTLPPME